MKKRIAITVAVVLALGIAMALLLGTSSRRDMPVYQGRTAQQWLGEVFTTNRMQALKALREMGPNVLPVIVRAFEKEDSAWDRFYQRKYPKLPFWLHSRLSRPMADEERWSAAEMAAINVSAKAAVPDFTRLMAKGNRARQGYLILPLVDFIGPEDTNCVAVLIQCLQSSNPEMRKLAATGLERIGPGARAAVPALVAVLAGRNLDGTFQNLPFALKLNAAQALWRIDHQTNASADIFREALISSDPRLRYQVWYYLNEIQPDDASLIPLIADLLHAPDTVWQMLVAKQIGKYGPAAKAAVPDLIKLADSSDVDVQLRQRARQSLRKIDPKAAAQNEH